MSDFSKIIEDKNPVDVPMNETGFYNYLEATNAPTKWPGILVDYLGTLGFVKGSDTITPFLLHSLKRIWQHRGWWRVNDT